MAEKYKHTYEPALIESCLTFPNKVVTYLYLGEKCTGCPNYKVNDYFMIKDTKTNRVVRTKTNEEILALYPNLPIIKRKWA